MYNLFNKDIEHKSDKKANEFRNKGNEFYEREKYLEAIIFYNKAIAYSCSKKELSLCYANRSAAFLEIESYDECLENIQLARENGYPKDKISKLNSREEKCKMRKSKSRPKENFWNIFKLSYPANEKIPWIVNCVEVRETAKYGRGIYAKRDLKAGDILCNENIVFDLIHPNSFNYCSNCSNSRMLNLIPCARTASMMFCSTECMQDFYSRTPEMDMALNDEINFLTKVSAPFHGYKQFDDFISETDLSKLNKTIFDYDFSNTMDPNFNKNLITCLLSLKSKDVQDMGEDSSNLFDFVSKKTAHHLLGITTLNLNSYKYFNGAFPLFIGRRFISLFNALINHSCIPNVCTIAANNKNVTLVIKPVGAGEQIFCSYFNCFGNPLYEHDKNTILQIHNFQCDCKACIEGNFKLLLPITLPTTLFMNRKDTVKAKQILKYGWDLINYYNNDYSMQQQLFNAVLQNLNIMNTFDYYCSYPC